MTEKELAKHKEEQEAFLNETGDSNIVESAENEETDYSVLEVSEEIDGSKTIKFNTGLTGKELILLKDKYQRIRKKKASMMAEFDDYYYMLVAEKMTGIDIDILLNTKAKTFIKIKNHVRDFLGED